MKSQSTSAAPGIVNTPRSVVEVLMTDDEPTGSGGVSVSVSILPAGSLVSDDEEDKEVDEESGHVDDEEDVDDINHESLSKKTVRACSPGKRAQRPDIWNHVRRMTKHDVPDHGMKAETTTIECISPPTEDGISIFRKRQQHNLRSH